MLFWFRKFRKTKNGFSLKDLFFRFFSMGDFAASDISVFRSLLFQRAKRLRLDY